MDLSVQTGQKQAKMRFLITDLGNEDLILGYPWLANFEPKFSWKKGVIDVTFELNARLDLSRQATTKLLCLL